MATVLVLSKIRTILYHLLLSLTRRPLHSAAYRGFSGALVAVAPPQTPRRRDKSDPTGQRPERPSLTRCGYVHMWICGASSRHPAHPADPPRCILRSPPSLSSSQSTRWALRLCGGSAVKEQVNRLPESSVHFLGDPQNLQLPLRAGERRICLLEMSFSSHWWALGTDRHAHGKKKNILGKATILKRRLFCRDFIK